VRIIPCPAYCRAGVRSRSIICYEGRFRHMACQARGRGTGYRTLYGKPSRIRACRSPAISKQRETATPRHRVEVIERPWWSPLRISTRLSCLHRPRVCPRRIGGRQYQGVIGTRATVHIRANKVLEGMNVNWSDHDLRYLPGGRRYGIVFLRRR
jgi:hypothetical protein